MRSVFDAYDEEFDSMTKLNSLKENLLQDKEVRKTLKSRKNSSS